MDCFGYIDLIFFDEIANEAISIGGAGFLTEQEFSKAWANLSLHTGHSSFQAEHLDCDGDILEDKTISAQTCEALTGKPITTLIIEGRAKHAADFAAKQ